MEFRVGWSGNSHIGQIQYPSQRLPLTISGVFIFADPVSTDLAHPRTHPHLQKWTELCSSHLQSHIQFPCRGCSTLANWFFAYSGQSEAHKPLAVLFRGHGAKNCGFINLQFLISVKGDLRMDPQGYWGPPILLTWVSNDGFLVHTIRVFFGTKEGHSSNINSRLKLPGQLTTDITTKLKRLPWTLDFQAYSRQTHNCFLSRNFLLPKSV